MIAARRPGPRLARIPCGDGPRHAQLGRPAMRIKDPATAACWLPGPDLPGFFDGRPVREAFAAGG